MPVRRRPDDADAILVPEDSDNADSILAPEDSDAEADGGDNDADAVASPTEDEKQMWLRQFEEMRSSQQRGDQSKLLFSMVPREQAMAIVTDAMPADVRREYFARSMAGARQSFSGASAASSAAGAAGGVVDGDADGELDGGDTAAAVRRASVASSAASADVRRGRAQLAWSLLRANWRDAVAAELDAGYNEYLQSRRKFDFWQFVFDTTVTQPTA
nr:hypothetical protein HK105_001956 [Polyrhizophydium stewartii]